MPNPVVGADGQITVPGYTAGDLTPAARSAYATQLQAESSSSTHPIESASDIRSLLRFSTCMRTHALPRWPDPNEPGEFHVKSADAGLAVQDNTDAGYLDRIESHFRPIQEFVFNYTDYPTGRPAQRALADYVTHCNGAGRDRRIAVLKRKHRVAA